MLVYSIILTGYIPTLKLKEFKQHMIQMAGHPENQMFHLNVYKDILHEDLYKVKMTFKDKKEMFKVWMTGPMKPITKYGGLPKPTGCV